MWHFWENEKERVIENMWKLVKIFAFKNDNVIVVDIGEAILARMCVNILLKASNLITFRLKWEELRRHNNINRENSIEKLGRFGNIKKGVL